VSDTRYNYTLRTRRSDETLREDGRNRLLLRAATQGQLPRIQHLLRLGADVDFADDAGFTALHHAVSSGFEDCVDELISKGADINVLASCGVVLNVAADKGRSHIAEILLRARADCDAAIAFAEDSGFDVGVLREFLTQALRSSGLESTSALYSVAETNHWGKPTLTNTRVASGDVDEYKHDPRSTKTSSYTSETVGDGTLVERTHGPRSTRPGLGTHARSEEDMDLYDYDSYSTKYSSLTASVDTNTQQRHVPNITQSSESSLKQASSMGSFFWDTDRAQD
jgi:hypothetical protein